MTRFWCGIVSNCLYVHMHFVLHGRIPLTQPNEFVGNGVYPFLHCNFYRNALNCTHCQFDIHRFSSRCPIEIKFDLRLVHRIRRTALCAWSYSKTAPHDKVFVCTMSQSNKKMIHIFCCCKNSNSANNTLITMDSWICAIWICVAAIKTTLLLLLWGWLRNNCSKLLIFTGKSLTWSLSLALPISIFHFRAQLMQTFNFWTTKKNNSNEFCWACLHIYPPHCKFFRFVTFPAWNYTITHTSMFIHTPLIQITLRC